MYKVVKINIYYEKKRFMYKVVKTNIIRKKKRFMYKVVKIGEKGKVAWEQVLEVEVDQDWDAYLQDDPDVPDVVDDAVEGAAMPVAVGYAVARLVLLSGPFEYLPNYPTTRSTSTLHGEFAHHKSLPDQRTSSNRGSTHLALRTYHEMM